MPRTKQTARGYLARPPVEGSGENPYSVIPLGGAGAGENPHSVIPLGGFADPAAAAAQAALIAKRDAIMAQPLPATPGGYLASLGPAQPAAPPPKIAKQRLMGIGDAVNELRKPSLVARMAKAAGYMRREGGKK